VPAARSQLPDDAARIDEVLFLAFENPFKRVRTGGAEGMFRSIRAVSATGLRTTVFAVDRALDLSVGAELVDDGVEVRLFARDLSVSVVRRLLRWPWPVASRYTTTLAHALSARDLSRSLVVVEGVQMCAYRQILRRATPSRTVLRLHNVESSYWSQMAAASRGIRRLLAAITAAHYRLVERIVREFDVVMAVSSEELHAVETAYPDLRGRLVLVPPIAVGSPAPADAATPDPDVLCYFGDLSVPANLDGVRWFVAEVLPRVRLQLPRLRLRLAGKDSHKVSGPGVEACGFVDDLDRFVHSSTAMVVPLRFGAGVKMKLLDALCYEIPCAVTPVAIQGTQFVESPLRELLCVGESAAALAAAIVAIFLDPVAARRRAAITASIVRRDNGADAFLRGLGLKRSSL
jgi:hypothetical protein